MAADADRAPAGGQVLMVLLLALFFAGPALNVQGQSDASSGTAVALRLERDFDLNNATLLIGTTNVSAATMNNPGFVAVRAMNQAATSVTVCPVSPGGQGVVRPLLLAQLDCDGGVEHASPRLQFGPRTSLQFAGPYKTTPAQTGSMTIVVPDGPYGGIAVVSVLGNGAVAFSYADHAMRFQPIVGSSQVRVVSDDERFYYNGTGWQFLFQGAGEVQMLANGYHSSYGSSINFAMRPMPVGEMKNTTRPHVMLALQEALLGPDGREAVGNLTGQMRLSRSPVFLNGAVVGTLNGTIGSRNLAQQQVAHAQFGALSGHIDTDALVANGPLDLLIVERGIWSHSAPGDVPWLFGAIVWILAAAIYFLGRVAPKPTWAGRISDIAAPILLFLIAEAVLASAAGTGALALMYRGVYGPGASLRLLVFSLSAMLGVIVLIYLPIRLMVRHLAPPRLAWTASPAALLLAAVYAWIWSADMLAIAFQIARL